MPRRRRLVTQVDHLKPSEEIAATHQHALVTPVHGLRTIDELYVSSHYPKSSFGLMASLMSGQEFADIEL